MLCVTVGTTANQISSLSNFVTDARRLSKFLVLRLYGEIVLRGCLDRIDQNKISLKDTHPLFTREVISAQKL